MLGINADDPEWQWAAYQLDAAAYAVGQRAVNEQTKAAHKAAGTESRADDWDNLPRVSPSMLQSMLR